MQNLKNLLLLVIFGFSAAPAMADFDDQIYVGLSGGLSLIKPRPNTTGYENDKNEDGGIKFFLGWDFAERWSVEGYYSDLGEATLKQATGLNLTPASGSVAYQALGVSALYYIWGDDGAFGRQDRTGWSVFGKAGLGMLDTSSDSLPITQLESTHFMLGAGIEWAFDSGLGLRAEIDAYDEDAQFFSVGFMWRFGGDRNSESGVDRQRTTQSAVVQNSNLSPTPLESVAPITNPVIAAPEPQRQSEPLFDQALEGVNFLSGSADLTAQSKQILDSVARKLMQYPDVSVAIMAHTDNAGDASANLDLSKRRALAVARFLAEQGVEPRRLRPEAYGESRPRASNASPEGKRQNRRVELRRL